MYDLAVIGLGAAGLEAVQIALKNNLKVIAFEKNEIGGSFLNSSSIPMNTILHSSKFLKKVENSSKIGINLFSKPGYNWQIMLDRKIEIVNKFNKLLNSYLSKNITLIKAEAELFINYDTIEIYADDNIYQAKNIIISTGSIPNELSGLPFDNEFIIHAEDLFKMQEIPKNVTIVGSGSVGLECAQILANLGAKVQLIEKEAKVAPSLDVELQKKVEKFLKTSKIQTFKNDFIVKVSNDQVFLKSGIAFDTNCILVATGRKSNPCKILINGCAEPFIIKAEADGTCEIDNLYLIGDAQSSDKSIASAIYQAKGVMAKILQTTVPETKLVPSVIQITPPIASIGLKEQDIDLFDGYEIKKISLSSILKSWCNNDTDGMVKVIIKDNVIVGAHVVSEMASEIISIFSILIDRKITTTEIEDMIFPYPSYAQAILEAIKSE